MPEYNRYNKQCEFDSDGARFVDTLRLALLEFSCPGEHGDEAFASVAHDRAGNTFYVNALAISGASRSPSKRLSAIQKHHEHQSGCSNGLISSCKCAVSKIQIRTILHFIYAKAAGLCGLFRPI